MHKTIFDPNKDFTSIKYPVFSVEKDLLDKLPELAPYVQLLANSESEGRVDIDKLIRYIMVLYDKKSPLIRHFANLDQRKKEAALLAGYDLDVDAKRVESLFDFTDPELQLLALYFLEEQSDMWFANLVSNEQTFYEYQRALLTEVRLTDDKDKMQTLVIKSKLQDECEKIAERVEKYYSKVYGDGEEKVKAKTKDFSPESIARRR